MKTKQEYKGTVEVCCHRVEFSYWGFKTDLTEDVEKYLTEEAERRSKEQIIEGYREGELNCLYVAPDGATDEEIKGWWKIVTD